MANRVGGIVTKFAHTERELIVAVMLVTGIMSGFLSNTGTAAILIPIVIGTASKSGFSRSRLLLPLIFAAAMGGNLSIIGAPGNLLGKAALQNVGVEISFFEYGFVGLPILLISTAFFACVGYRFLPEKRRTWEIPCMMRSRTFPMCRDGNKWFPWLSWSLPFLP